MGNRYTWIDPETGLNLASSSSAVLETYGSMTEAGLRLNQLNRNASIFHPAAVTTMQLIDYAVEDASFLRINNITVGYTLPKTWMKKAFLQNVRIYLTGYNLFCWTNYTGADPEVDTSSKRNALTRVSIMRLIRKAVRLSVVSILRSNSKYINVYESNL